MSRTQTENKTVKNETETGTVVAPAMPVGTVEVHGGSVSGEICKSDLQIPSLKLVQQVGDLGELFTPGSFVLNNEHGVSDGTVETTVTVAHWNKYYIENLEYGTDQTPDTAKTMQEVVQKGGTTEWQGKTPPTWTPVGVATCMVEGKDDLHFPFAYEDKQYAIALWTMRNTAYRRAGRVIMTAAAYNLKTGLEYGNWLLSSKRETLGKNKVFVPVLKTGGRNTDEFAAWIRQLTR
jgi:hypothetical protein